MLNVLRTLIQWRKTIVLAGLLTAAVMAAVSFVLPKWYRAQSSVFPPTPKSGLPSFVDLVQGLQLPILGPSSIGKNPNTIYVDVLQSRRITEQIIEEFGFMETYGAKTMTAALDEFHKHTGFTLVENGLLTISFEDNDAERAAAVTNRLVELLDEYNQRANNLTAARTREFISGQIKLREKSLAEAEGALKSFQTANQTLDLDEQVKATIDVVSKLTADAIAAEVELEILKQYTSTSSQEYIRKEKEYEELLEQLKKFKIYSARDENDFVRSFFPTFDKLPEVAMEMARLTRTVMIEEKVYELLVKEYEKARIEEARDTPTVQVLDTARVPELRSRPKRKILAIVGGVAGIGWSSLLALFVTAWRTDNSQGRALRDAFAPLFRDLGRVFRRG